MDIYLNLLRDVIDNGIDGPDRTGTGTRSVFGRQIRFDLSEGFPLLTTKRLHFKSIVYELLWFLRGETNKQWLNDHGVSIWDEWATENGDLGPIYGEQWRSWKAPGGDVIDQLDELIRNLQHRPYSRRHVVTAWNPSALPDESCSPQDNVRMGKMALAPCHCLFQFYVAYGRLSCQLYQRSADLFLGVPYNIASYALLTHLIAQQCDLEVGEFIHTFGDLHLYHNHFTDEIIFEQLRREPRSLPMLRLLRRPPSLFDYHYDDIELLNYQPHGTIRAPIAI
jgi:thymidylate synthase